MASLEFSPSEAWLPEPQHEDLNAAGGEKAGEVEPQPAVLTSLTPPRHTLVLGPPVTPSINGFQQPTARRSDRLAAKKKTRSMVGVA